MEITKELCEICNIKPYYGVWINIGDLDTRYTFVVNQRKYRLIADVRWNVDDEDKLRNLKPNNYPDLYDPENFMTLLHTRLDNGMNIWRVVNDLAYRTPNTAEEFIKLIVKALKGEIPLFNEKDLLIKAIQNIKWTSFISFDEEV